MKVDTHTKVITEGFTIDLDPGEAMALQSALLNVNHASLFPLVEALREGMGLSTITSLVDEAVGEGHYDNIIGESMIQATKRLRGLYPILGLKRAKDILVARRALLIEANREIEARRQQAEAIAALREKLTGDPAPEPEYKCGICGKVGGH